MQFISAATLVSSIFSKCQNLLIFLLLIPTSNAHGVNYRYVTTHFMNKVNFQ